MSPLSGRLLRPTSHTSCLIIRSLQPTTAAAYADLRVLHGGPVLVSAFSAIPKRRPTLELRPCFFPQRRPFPEFPGMHNHRNDQRRGYKFETIKLTAVKPEHVRPLLFVTAVAVCVVVYDIYYYIYKRKPKVPSFSQGKFANFPLKDIIPVTHDTSLFRFAAGVDKTTKEYKKRPCCNLTVPAPSHLIVMDDTCQIARSYTPITYGPNYFDFLVKKYEGGSISTMIHGLAVGDYLRARGPFMTWEHTPEKYDTIAMIAGGTGITPMYQLIKSIFRDPRDKTKISLIYANKSEADVLLGSELEILANAHPGRLKVTHTIENSKSSWTGHTGRISEELLQSELPGKDARCMILVCGPEGMVRGIAGTKENEYEQGALGGLLAKLGYERDQVFKF
ncbi:hypothetical protein DFJ73DRAFT_806999 [Zopfochytrium polystomum]|nr:hypothetical protein DFJ73DRAFT_806999 [Zopfochytrium polystomum]